MKLYNILENKEINYEHVFEWIKQNCRDIDGFTLDHRELKDFSVFTNKNGEIQIDAKEYFIIATDDEYLPYKFHRCKDLTVIAPNLKDCSQFPKVLMSNEDTIELNNCDSLDFGTFPTDNYYRLKLILKHMKNITIAKIFKNPNLSINALTIANCTHPDLHDCSQWDMIKAYYFGFECATQIKNFTHILNIRASQLKIFQIIFVEDSYYDQKNVDILNRIIRKYREDRHNAEDYAMDMTLDLIDKGFEDSV